MHNNYYFLKTLSKQLHDQLNGFTICSCFSQHVDELIIECNNSTKSFFIKASLVPSFCCLSFPSSFSRAKRNSVDLFKPIILKKIISVNQFLNERSFAFNLEDDWILLFKMHGNFANIVLYKDDQIVELFKNQFQEKHPTTINCLDRTIDWSKKTFDHSVTNLSHTYFTFGKHLCQYLESHFAGMASTEEKWIFFQRTLTQLNNPTFYICEYKHDLVLLLFPIDPVILSHTNAVDAINDFFHRYVVQKQFQSEKKILLHSLSERLKKAQNFIQKNEVKLQEITTQRPYQLWADLIMANLHLISPGSKRVSLVNFYNGKIEIVPLTPQFNAIRNAETYYRKSKNSQLEITNLQTSILNKQKELIKLQEALNKIEQVVDRKNLKAIDTLEVGDKKNLLEKKLPYHLLEYRGFQIRIGKNARANDELTFKYSYKEDLWLHAKDVAGSHVIIKYQANKKFTKDIIERAAELAAYYSKRKNDSVCPVIYTPRKFVRKRKGYPAGAVVVEKETIILVEPKR